MQMARTALKMRPARVYKPEFEPPILSRRASLSVMARPKVCWRIFWVGEVEGEARKIFVWRDALITYLTSAAGPALVGPAGLARIMVSFPIEVSEGLAPYEVLDVARGMLDAAVALANDVIEPFAITWHESVRIEFASITR